MEGSTLQAAPGEGAKLGALPNQKHKLSALKTKKLKKMQEDYSKRGVLYISRVPPHLVRFVEAGGHSLVCGDWSMIARTFRPILPAHVLFF